MVCRHTGVSVAFGQHRLPGRYVLAQFAHHHEAAVAQPAQPLGQVLASRAFWLRLRVRRKAAGVVIAAQGIAEKDLRVVDLGARVWRNRAGVDVAVGKAEMLDRQIGA